MPFWIDLSWTDGDSSHSGSFSSGLEPLVESDLAEAWIVVRNQRGLFELGPGIGDIGRGFDSPGVPRRSQVLRHQIAYGEPLRARDLKDAVAGRGQRHF